MTITLSDISTATAHYIDNEVDVTVARVTANVRDGNDGKYSIRISNASAPTGVRLHDIVLHLTSGNAGVVTLFPPGWALLTPRATNDPNAPRLPSSTPVGEMFIFLADTDSFEPNATLDVGESFDLELDYHAESAGTTMINAHVHATVEADDLLPRSNGRNGSREVTIRN